MDTSETYIKMCQQATEMQDEWAVSDWDYCYCEKTERVVVLSGYETDSGYYGHEVDSSIFKDEVRIIGTVAENGGCGGEGRHIWLPSQSQLQAMVYGLPFESSLAGLKIPEKSDMWTVLPHLLSFAYNWEFKEDTIVLTQGQPSHSMEQLWLAFVMKEKYNKIWAEGDWVAP